MEASQASITAIIVSLIRAHHTRSFATPLINDPWGERLVPPEAIEALRARMPGDASGDDFLSRHGLSASIVLRARYCEDALLAAIAAGVDQYVLVGAGLDSFALRRPPQATALKIFEIDHPASQGFKHQRLRAAGIEPETLPGTKFIAADLAETAIDAALAGSGFDPQRPSFFGWMGVTMYLTREANRESLQAMRRVAAGASEIVLTYMGHEILHEQQALLAEARRGSAAEMREVVAALGEPFQSAFTPPEFAELVAGTGFDLIEDLGIGDVIERYRHLGAGELPPSNPSRIARLRVG